MIGEHVYEDPESKVVAEVDEPDFAGEVDETEVITATRAAELLATIIDKYSLPATVNG